MTPSVRVRPYRVLVRPCSFLQRSWCAQRTLLLRPPDRHHRAGRLLDHSLGGAAQEEMTQTAVAAGAHGDQVRPPRLGLLGGDMGGIARAGHGLDDEAVAPELLPHLVEPPLGFEA